MASIKMTRKIPAAPFDAAAAAHAISAYTAAVMRAFNAVRPGAAALVSRRLPELIAARTSKVAKAGSEYADLPDEDAWGISETIADEIDVSGLDLMVGDAEDIAAEIAQDAAALALGQFGIDLGGSIVDVIDQNAADWARERAAEMVGKHYDENGDLVDSDSASRRIDDSTRDMIRNAIYDGLQSGARSTDIAAGLEGMGDENYPFSERRAALIANSELASAHSHGDLEAYQGVKSMGVGVKKSWLVADAPCPVCQENADAGPIELDDVFPSGDDAPQAHPWCLCSLIAEVDEADSSETAAEQYDAGDNQGGTGQEDDGANFDLG